MLTKLPDYIISDCGYPNWGGEKEKLFTSKMHANLWRSSSIWSTRSSNFGKLLPLRETLTDYYVDKLIISQNESMYKTTKPAQRCYKNNNNSICGRQAQMHVNEVMKSGKRKQYHQQQQCALDKRRSCVNGIDKDMDQF